MNSAYQDTKYDERGQTERPQPIFKRDLADYSRRRGTTGPYADNLDIDVLIVGAGFGGVYLLHEMRKSGYKTVIYEAGTSLGGVWRFNTYPGARTDSEVPVYELSIPELWKDWTWSTNYPNYQELQQYFDYVDKKLDLSKNCAYETVVDGAQFDEDEGKWTVTTVDGRKAKCRFLIIATGFASKRYIPDYKGIENFKGTVQHVAFWPPGGSDVRGKRCAVIGTGASGVQVIQEWGPLASEVKVFQRSPNMAIPMGKRDLTAEEQNQLKPLYPQLFALRERNFGGYHFDFAEQNVFDVPTEEREAFYEKLWRRGGFSFWLGNYKNYLYDMKANRDVYNFWVKKIRARVHDPRKRELLCPLEPPFPFGVKRPCLEQNYFEQFNRDSVDVVDISNKSGNGIQEFTETGIKTTDGSHYEFDFIAIATGFDISTGGMTSMGLKSVDGLNLQDEWKSAAGRWIRDAINAINRQGLKFVDPTPEASQEWKQKINDISNTTLFPTCKTTHMGGDIPGKAFEQVSYPGGLVRYHQELRAALPDWKGFRTVQVT
ncbi:hypothetical protein OEA41_008590 [Lepraria neglecta]|uniref:FAD/NAD(P)-binding domain-containing protein n=1 Tax=Lepraria neglecta TaxID=209136 RepID=A0AAD9Z3D3_9LECA|nr:hypothetical protein OEA41_008590 [Lepraria neglecta]